MSWLVSCLDTLASVSVSEKCLDSISENLTISSLTTTDEGDYGQQRLRRRTCGTRDLRAFYAFASRVRNNYLHKKAGKTLSKDFQVNRQLTQFARLMRSFQSALTIAKLGGQTQPVS